MDGNDSQTSQPRGEDGRFVSAATPPPDAPVSEPQAAPSTDATTQAPGVAPAGDAYDVVANQLNAREAKSASPAAVAEDRTTPTRDSLDPTPPGQTTADAQQQPPSPSPTAEKPAATPAADAEAIKPYGDTLSRREHDLLKSVPGMLVAPDEWREMSVTERAEHLADVRAIRNSRNREFQQNNSRGRQPQPAPGDDRSTSETGQPPRAGGTLEGDGVSPPARQPQPAGQAGASDAGLPADAMAALQQVAAEFGEDSPLYRATLLNARQNAELAERLERHDRERQDQAQARAMELQARRFEDAEFARLQAKYPGLTDATRRDEIRQTARDLYLLRQGQGRPIEGAEALRLVTHNTLYPEIQRQQQQQAAANRQRSLNGTFDRSTPAANPAATRQTPRPAADVYDLAAEGLGRAYAAGQTGETARRSAMATLTS